MSGPKRILFDATPMVNGNKSGVGYYTFNLIKALADEYPYDVQLVGHYFNFLGRRGDVNLPEAPNISYVQSRLVPGKVLSITRKLGFQPPLELFFKRRGDIALFTNFVSLPSVTDIPCAVAVHDLAFIDMPEYVAEKNRQFLQRFVPRSIRHAKFTITISNATKGGIESRFGINASDILVTPIPPGKKLVTQQWPVSVPAKQSYVLFVSTLEPRKNVSGLVLAYEKLAEDIRRKYALVLAGGDGWYMDETMSYIRKLQRQGLNIITTGYVSDLERAALYENASLFVMPSHYEGFGMPLLEAMDYGVPVLASDIPVFHEVAGDAARYFDKDNPAKISESIASLLKDSAACDQLVATGNKRLQDYSWPEIARSFFDRISKN